MTASVCAAHTLCDRATPTTIAPRAALVRLEPGDGTRIWVEIGFPRDPNYRAPANLTPGKFYAMPVIVGVDKKKGVPRLTIRTDIQPFEAPDMG